MKLRIKDKKDLSEIEYKKVAELLMATWPPEDESVTLDKVIDFYKNGNQCSFNKVLLYFDEENLIGHTEVFNRDIIIDSARKQILALASVCVKPNYRGKNLGAELIKQAFSFVDKKQFKHSIFQTNVPGFYEKLGCKKIFNRFINSKSEINIHKNPWRDPNVMVYPKTSDLGESVIDLNGECY